MPDLRLDRLTSSRVAAFRRCPRYHAHVYLDRYEVPPSAPQALGTAVHAQLARLWSGAAIELTGDAIADALLAGYVAHWGRPAPCAVEVPFDCPLPSVDLLAVHETLRLAGTIDALDFSLGAIVEHKTASSIDEDYWARIAMDSQISQYVIGAESLGAHVTSVIYDVIRTPALRPLLATPETSRKHTKDGKLYAAQRDQDETPEEFADRVRLDIAARPEHYFQRRTFVRTAAQLSAHLRSIWEWADLIMTDSRAQNTDACTRFGTCPFFHSCSTGSEPDYRRTPPEIDAA